MTSVEQKLNEYVDLVRVHFNKSERAKALYDGNIYSNTSECECFTSETIDGVTIVFKTGFEVWVSRLGSSWRPDGSELIHDCLVDALYEIIQTNSTFTIGVKYKSITDRSSSNLL